MMLSTLKASSSRLPSTTPNEPSPSQGSRARRECNPRPGTHSCRLDIDNRNVLASTMKAFASRVDVVTDTMRRLRPDLTDASYDLSLKAGRLTVVDDSLGERERVWLEESFNGDRELVRLAKDLNLEAVRTFDTNVECSSGERVGLRSYDGLSSTIDRSTRFLSLVKEIRATDVSTAFFWHDPFQRTAALLERQIVNDTYEYRAQGGTIELIRNIEGTSMYGWSERA